MPLRVLFTGGFDPAYNRTAILRAGLRRLGHEVTEFVFSRRDSAAARRVGELAAASDLVFLPSFTHKDVPFVKKAAAGRPVVFDPLVSRYMTKALDYKKISRYGLGAFLNKRYDRKALEAADLVITDTRAHLEWFAGAYGVPRSKMAVVYIGNDFSEFSPAEKEPENEVFTAGFYGGFIPLQGAMNILGAALLLKGRSDVKFRLVGNGFQYARALAFAREHGLGNVEFPGWLTPAALCADIRAFDAALGVFGETVKTGLVIPNKLYHYAACRKAVVTRDTPAVRELFGDGRDVLLVDGSPASIAAAVLRLKDDPALRTRLAEGAYALVRGRHDEEATARTLLQHAEGLARTPRKDGQGV